MKIDFTLNKKPVSVDVPPDTSLYALVRDLGCLSVKCGCDSSNCGLCTVMLEGRPVLSCSVPAPRAMGRRVETLEGFQAEAARFGRFLAARGADQCGFCNPGLIMNIIAMTRELENPTRAQVKGYLAGNLCRCTGYAGQEEAVMAYLTALKEERDHEDRR